MAGDFFSALVISGTNPVTLVAFGVVFAAIGVVAAADEPEPEPVVQQPPGDEGKAVDGDDAVKGVGDRRPQPRRITRADAAGQGAADAQDADRSHPHGDDETAGDALQAK